VQAPICPTHLKVAIVLRGDLNPRKQVPDNRIKEACVLAAQPCRCSTNHTLVTGGHTQHPNVKVQKVTWLYIMKGSNHTSDKNLGMFESCMALIRTMSSARSGLDRFRDPAMTSTLLSARIPKS
jgi:hypothetical protein